VTIYDKDLSETAETPGTLASRSTRLKPASAQLYSDSSTPAKVYHYSGWLRDRLRKRESGTGRERLGTIMGLNRMQGMVLRLACRTW